MFTVNIGNECVTPPATPSVIKRSSATQQRQSPTQDSRYHERMHSPWLDLVPPVQHHARAWIARQALVVVGLLSLLGFAAAQSGFIQVRAEVGVRVIMDGILVGVTEASLGGLIIQNAPAGERRLRFEKDGFSPQSTTVQLAAGQVLLVEVAAFQPASATVIIQCVPIECVVDIPSLGLRNVTKTIDELVVSNAPLGVHSGTLRPDGLLGGLLSRRTPVTIEVCADGDTVRVFGLLLGDSPRVTATSAMRFLEGCERENQGLIAAGGLHSLALLSNGTVRAWGWNVVGQLGDGTFTNRSTPVSVSGLSGVTTIATGWSHSLALLSDGTVRAWGYNEYGQLGDGTTTPSLTPVRVPGF
jgi:hypothetical protein